MADEATPHGAPHPDDDHQAVAPDPAAADGGPKLRPSQALVFDLLMADGPMTDEQLITKLASSSGKISPRRLELYKAGLVEQVGTGRTASGKSAVLWGVVPAERVAEARERAATRQPRRTPVEKLPLEVRKAIVLRLLRDKALNEAILADRAGAEATARARREARAVHTDRERRRRELKAQIDEAERTGSPLVAFLKTKRNLRNTADGMMPATELVRDAVEHAQATGIALFSAEQLEELEELFTEVSDMADEGLATIARALGRDLADIIDVDAIDLDDFALPEGGLAHDLDG